MATLLLWLDTACGGIVYASRQANKPAHQMAKLACTLKEFSVWIEEGSECIMPAILADKAVPNSDSNEWMVFSSPKKIKIKMLTHSNWGWVLW